jgi:hypothetical protein
LTIVPNGANNRLTRWGGKTYRINAEQTAMIVAAAAMTSNNHPVAVGRKREECQWLRA